MLKFLLDEQISPSVGAGLRRKNRQIVILGIAEWDNGQHLGVDDALLLQAANAQDLTLVTYDRRTIPPLLKLWAEQGRTHGGVVFVDEKTISPSDIGGLIRALLALWTTESGANWRNRIVFLRQPGDE